MLRTQRDCGVTKVVDIEERRTEQDRVTNAKNGQAKLLRAIFSFPRNTLKKDWLEIAAETQRLLAKQFGASPPVSTRDSTIVIQSTKKINHQAKKL